MNGERRVRSPLKNLASVAVASFLGVCCAVVHADTAPNAEYLPDLLADRMIACTQGWGELRLDASVGATGQASPKLRIKDKEYSHGLGHHANGEIVVDLSGQFKTFQTEVGLQWAEGRDRGSVIFQVFVDGRKLFDSGLVRENDPPRPVTVSVEGAAELRLVANDAGDGITADCANWADAKLTRNPAAASNLAPPAVDVAPFARVLSWDPKVMEGTKASRSDEMPAEDIAPYKEILPAGDKSYAVPMADGTGSVGLQWEENRILRRMAIQFPSGTVVPPAESIQFQYWTGESAWQGKWQPTKSLPEKVESSWVWRLGYQELPQGTQKARWVFSGVERPVVLNNISAFTRSRWRTVDVRIEPARPGPAKKAEIEIYNGDFLNPSQASFTRCTWDGVKPLLLKVRASVARNYKADRTVLRFQMPDTAFGVAIETLLASDCVYVPHANVFVARDPSPVTPAQYLKKIAAQKTVLEEVRRRPDQDFRHACAVIHNPIQDRHDWVPMMISLACDNRKFLVGRTGSIVFNEYNHADDYPGESDGVHTVAANIGQWRFVPSFGSGQALQITRHLSGGWLPMPVTTARDKNITYQQTTFIAPVGETPAGKPAWLRERALGVVEYLVKNTATEPSRLRLAIQLAPEQDRKKSVHYQELSEGVMATSGDRILAFIDKRKAASLSCKIEATGIVLSGTLSAGSENTCTVLLPAWKVAPNDYASLLEGSPAAPRVESYWKALLEPAMQIEIPDELLSNLFRASQVNCMLAARNQDRSELVVPWISSIHFAYPESEANSVIRGMDVAGHADFARRALEFFLKQCNAAGFITILINAPSGKVGYTIVGTGEVLWTLGEHYQRTRDQAWLRKVAPDVVRICHWVIRQREKTKRLDARGEKVPEYGLTPPGVSADWNRFAYRFFNEAQYCCGLENAGKVGYTIASKVARGEIEAIVQLPGKCTAKNVVLRLRHPEDKRIQSVTVQGKPHMDFDPQKETIALVPAGETITVQAKY